MWQDWFELDGNSDLQPRTVARLVNATLWELAAENEIQPDSSHDTLSPYWEGSGSILIPRE